MIYKLSYPKHVKRAIDLFKVLGKNINLLIWVVDARIPNITLKYLKEFIERVEFNKKILVFVNKMDLVDKFDYQGFKDFLKNEFNNIKLSIFYGSNKNSKQLLNYLDLLAKKELFLNCIVVGLPNVGKSSLINSLSNKRKVEVSSIPGTTRKFRWISLKYNIKILDSPGIVIPVQIQEEELCELIKAGIINHSFVNIPKDKLEKFLI